MTGTRVRKLGSPSDVPDANTCTHPVERRNMASQSELRGAETASGLAGRPVADVDSAIAGDPGDRAASGPESALEAPAGTAPSSANLTEDMAVTLAERRSY